MSFFTRLLGSPHQSPQGLSLALPRLMASGWRAGVCVGLFMIAAVSLRATTAFPIGMTVDAATPKVTFTWTANVNSLSTLRVDRRPLAGGEWEHLGAVSHPTKTFVDTGVQAGSSYEYRLYVPLVTGGHKPFIVMAPASFNAPLEDSRGGVILVVDNNNKDLLAGELRQLEMDLVGDGWFVKRLDFDPIGVGDHRDLKAAIKAIYDANPGINSLLLFGDLPYARSGLIAPDGHTPSTTPPSDAPFRAHETDVYFADMDGNWTDTVRNQPVPHKTWDDGEGINVPGDGKFDPNTYPGAVELATGRVYFRNMVATRKRGFEYLRDYLHKNHAWRHGHRQVSYKAIGGDAGYQYLWQNWLNPMFGPANVSTSGFSLLTTEARYFGVGIDSINLTRPTQAIFMTNFRSWKQHWARTDNLIVRNMAQPDWGLNSTWGARPASFLHSMAAGKTIGHGFLASQNDVVKSSNLRDYYSVRVDLATTTFADGAYDTAQAYVSYNLMGDPTLRMHVVPSVGAVTASRSGSVTQLGWTASPASGLAGYHVYRSSERLGPYQRLTESPVAGISYSDTSAQGGTLYYQVRAVALTGGLPTGAYYNQSQGVFARINADDSVNRAPSAASAALSVKHNTPSWFRFEGSDPDGDTLTPVILRNPIHGQIRWREGQPFYISSKDFVGTETVVFAMSDGLALSEPATLTFHVGPAGSTLIGWKIANGANISQAESFIAPAIHSDSVAVVGYGAVSTWPANDQLSFRYVGSSLNAANYLGFSVQPRAGYRVSLDRVAFSLCAAVGDVATFELRASTDNFATHVVIPSQFGNTLTGLGITTRNVGQIDFADLSTIPELQDVSAPIRFRLHIWKTGVSSAAMSLGKLTEADGFVDGIEDLVVTGTVSKISGANLPPSGAADSYSLFKDAGLTVDAAGGVLANDTDSDGDELSALLLSGPASGTLVFNRDGSFVYTPVGGYTGADSFTYLLSDGVDTTGPVSVALTVMPAVSLPSWRQQWFGTQENSGDAANVSTPAGDGIANLLKYATQDGMADPSVPGIEPGTIALNETGDLLEFTYPRGKSAFATGTGFAVTWSDTLAPESWSAADVFAIRVADQGATELVTVSVPRGAGNRRFVRLEVTESAIGLGGGTPEFVATVPQGVMELNIPGGGATSVLGINLMAKPAYSGPVSAAGANAVTVDAADLAQRMEAGRAYVLLVTSGDGIGVNTMVLGRDGGQLTLADDLSDLLTPGVDTIQITELSTIFDIFGLGGEVLAGGTAATADLVQVRDAMGTGDLLSLYYSKGGINGIGWRAIGKGSRDFSGHPIYFTDGVSVIKKSTGPAKMELMGGVQKYRVLQVVPEGFVAHATVFAAGVTLAGSDLYKQDQPVGSLVGGTAAKADQISFDADGDGLLETYYYSTGGINGIGWRRLGSGSAPQGAVEVPSGFFIHRKGPALTVERRSPY